MLILSLSRNVNSNCIHINETPHVLQGTTRAGVEAGTTISLSLTIDGIVSFPDLFQRSYYSPRLLSCARSKMSTEGSTSPYYDPSIRARPSPASRSLVWFPDYSFLGRASSCENMPCAPYNKAGFYHALLAVSISKGKELNIRVQPSNIESQKY